MKKILCYICAHLKIVATTIYSLTLIIIMIFPPIAYGKSKGILDFVYFRNDLVKAGMSINIGYLFAEILVVSLIYFAFMLFILKK
mgnify:CR=1|tara:strand:- start:234 stop:488 length:255 start_codon:yes stop_codon:yes gene_type:complete